MARTKLTPVQLSTGATRSYIATQETTTSTSFVDLTTTGPSVTVTIGANGLAIVMFNVEMWNSISASFADVALVASGANTIAAGTNPYRLFTQATGVAAPDNKFSYSTLLTGLSAGSTTFKLQYRVITSGTGTWKERELSVIPL